ncbi:MAG: TatD family hydrolase [Candidatus Omnitrophica bacterium]|nr:TatD family hydrolase [Candidatus Omnitrophota bacterium]
MIIETHAHLDFPEYKNDLDAVMARAKESGIATIINVSSSLKGCFASVDLSRRYDSIYAALGIHPHDAKEVDNACLDKIRELVASSKKIVAIGEVGLDFYRNLSPKETQHSAFVKFLKLSKELNLPLILHCREETPESREAQDMLFKAMEENLELPFKGVMHCFSGDEKLLRRCLDSGLHISFTCNVTFKKADRLREVLKRTPIDKLLLETDSPFLAPQTERGKRNEPAYLRYLVDAIAEDNEMQKKDIEEITTQNARRLFGI